MKQSSVLKKIEHIGNALPHPAMMFVMFCGFTIILSALLSLMKVSVSYPILVDGVIKQEHVLVKSLLDGDGLRFLFTNVVSNFSSFTPLATVLVAMLGVGVAEGSGLISAVLTQVVERTPKHLVSFMVVFAGVMSSIASDAGYVVLIPLGAIVFLRFGRHPLAGIAAAFAGVSGGYSANLFPGPTDAMLASISTEASSLSVHGGTHVLVTDNWYFLIASTFLITIIAALVTEKIIEPMLGPYHGQIAASDEGLSSSERKGLKWAGISALIYIFIIALMVIPSNGILRNPETGDILKSPFMDSIVFLIVLLFFIPGVVYGVCVKGIRDSRDVMKLMQETMKTMSGYIVLVFFAAQFIRFFSYTNIGTVIAVSGSELLARSHIPGFLLIALFVILTAIINIFMGSASAKWAILSPVFIPMFASLGFAPSLIQVAYRIGDSTTNIITPLMSYTALITVVMQKYEPKAKGGTLISLMLPYSLFLLIGWIILLEVFMWFHIPLGPGVSI